MSLTSYHLTYPLVRSKLNVGLRLNYPLIRTRLSAGIDYLSVTNTLPNREKFHEFLTSILGNIQFIVRENQSFRIADAVYYDHSLAIKFDGVLGALHIDDNGNYKVYLRLSGKYWEALPPIDHIRKLWQVQAWKCNVTRLDIRLDVWDTNLPTEEIVAACKRGDVSGFQVWDRTHGGQVGEDNHLILELGSRKSEHYARLYPHQWGEGEDAYFSDRFEIEFKGAKAQAAFNYLAAWKRWTDNNDSANHDISKHLISLVTGQFDFVNKSQGGTRSPKGVNKKDCGRLPFWQQFLEAFSEGVKITVTRDSTSWQGKVNWLHRQTAKTLFMLKQALGAVDMSELLHHLYDDARQRMTPEDWKLHAQLEQDKAKLVF